MATRAMDFSDGSAGPVLPGLLAGALRTGKDGLVKRWMERISARVALDPSRIFPSRELMEYFPLLIEGIADYMEDPADEITADVPVVARATELGEVRHQQGFDAHEILKEYEILGGILFDYLTRVVTTRRPPCEMGELLACSHRLFRAISVVQQVTTAHYLERARETISEREQRLRGFNRAVSHELKNRIGAIQGAGTMLAEDFVIEDPARRAEFQAMLLENARGMRSIIDDLLELSRMDADARRQRNILLANAVAEAVRQLRHFAGTRGVRVEVDEGLPAIEVPAAVVELALGNYLSNAIKYHDPEKPERSVRVRARVDGEEGEERCELVVEVCDNGVGVPEESRGSLFERFYRAPGTDGVPGTGLGLSIVRESVAAVGGRVWADFDCPGETVFALAIPCRRAVDRAGARR